MRGRQKNDQSSSKHRVRIAQPKGRHIQLRYFCPIQQREVRLSTESNDLAEAEQKRRELEARLTLGLGPKGNSSATPFGPTMSWDDFREQYRELHLTTLREGTVMHTESRLDVAERILKPRRLEDVADPAAMTTLQAKLLSGVESKRGKPRSLHTVRGYITSVLSVMNWAYLQGWLPAPVRIRKLKVGKAKRMKGRPITVQEFEAMLLCTAEVVGKENAAAWRYLLRGLWESGLRLNELMAFSWNQPGTLQPLWKDGSLPVLQIPAAMQKNDTEEDIPLLPGLEALLKETPPEQRAGWIFRPTFLGRGGEANRLKTRPQADWVGRLISRIGRKANVVVELADERTGRPVKYASAHDFRRAFAQRLLDAGVPPLVISRIMRHSSWETTRQHYAPGDVQQDAQVLRGYLSA